MVNKLNEILDNCSQWAAMIEAGEYEQVERQLGNSSVQIKAVLNEYNVMDMSEADLQVLQDILSRHGEMINIVRSDRDQVSSELSRLQSGRRMHRAYQANC